MRSGYSDTPNGGFRAWAYGAGRKKFKRFKPGTKPKTIQNWIRDTEVALRKTLTDDPAPGSLAEDVNRYLLQVRAMPTYAQRQRHLEQWRDALGADRARRDITAGDMRAVLHGWRLTHSAATCNKRRTALMHLWSILDGKGASNPVRDVPKFRAADPLPRGRDPHIIDAHLRARVRSRSRAVCRVLLWTGMRPVELARATPDDLDLEAKTVIARTAKGGRTRTIPLTAQAVSAWKEFIRDVGWDGDIPQAAPLNRWLKHITGLPIRVYDLRHSYGTALARAGTRLDVIAALMGHSTLELARRYVLAAVSADALTATRTMGRTSRPRQRRRPKARRVA